ncbi:MAG: hypothetical protein E7376_04855 [Clostridiales bacterium]|nr:hypothetical protein [Clostridiales bacterium]
MYQYIIDDETTKKVKDLTNVSKSVLEQFNEVDEKYATNKKHIDLNLQKLEHKVPTQQEVENKAKTSLNNYKNENLEQINNNYFNKSQQIDDSIEQIKSSTAEQKNDIVNTYSQIKNDAENDAIKRGLARSSIIVNKLENYNKGMLNELSVLASKSNDKIDVLNTQKSTLELEKESALNAFDIEYAIKLQEKIDSINEAIAKNEEAVIKYNNEISQLEAKWNEEQEQQRLENAKSEAEYFSKYGTYVIDTIKYNEKYNIAKKYFNSLDKQTAINELTGNLAYLENLGDTNYKKLLQEIKSRDN